MSRIHRQLRTLIETLLEKSLQSEMSMSPWKTRSGAIYNIGKVDGKIYLVAEPEVKLQSEDIHFVEGMRRADPTVKMLIKDVNSGSKMFWFRYEGAKVQVLKSKVPDRDLSVYVNGEKVTNPRRRDEKFITYADVVSYCVKFL